MPAKRKPRNQNIIGTVIIIIILLVAAYEFLRSEDVQLPVDINVIPTLPSTGAQTEWIKVYFTRPDPPDNLANGFDQYLLPALAAANETIDVASFDLNLPSVVNTLAFAAERGVAVRVVYDGVNGSRDLENEATGDKPFDAIKKLKAAKVGLVDGGRTSGLMHDKFIIIDGKTLFTGSWNLSYNDTFRNDNNILRITEPRLVANYQAKFNDMFVAKNFGPAASARAPYPSVIVDGTRVENYFSPGDQVMTRLIAAVKGAKRSVHFMVFTYTHDVLADAMIERAAAGVNVQGVIEHRGAAEGALPRLFCARLPVKVDGNRYTMHHKIMIIDGEIVITGSFNFTVAADTSNDENVLILRDSALARQYEQEYRRVSASAVDPSPADFPCSP